MRPACEHCRPYRALSKHICNVILRVPNTRSSSTLNEYISVEGESSSGCSPELSSTSYSSGEYFNLPSVVVHSRSILVTPRAFPASRRWVFGPLLIALRRHYILSFTYPSVKTYHSCHISLSQCLTLALLAEDEVGVEPVEAVAVAEEVLPEVAVAIEEVILNVAVVPVDLLLEGGVLISLAHHLKAALVYLAVMSQQLESSGRHLALLVEQCKSQPTISK